MMIQLRFVLIALLLQASSAPAFAADSKGYFQDDCSGTTIHITKFDGPHGGQQLVLRLSTGHLHYWYYSEESRWWDAEGKLCSVDGKCQESTHARVWVNYAKEMDKRISGKYEVDLNGQRLEGQFVVKNRKYKPLPICM
jgi:hypothetical protein